jgi:hypothetical protein
MRVLLGWVPEVDPGNDPRLARGSLVDLHGNAIGTTGKAALRDRFEEAVSFRAAFCRRGLAGFLKTLRLSVP